MNLFDGIFEPDPIKRITLKKILDSEYFKDIITHDEIIEEMKRR